MCQFCTNSSSTPVARLPDSCPPDLEAYITNYVSTCSPTVRRYRTDDGDEPQLLRDDKYGHSRQTWKKLINAGRAQKLSGKWHLDGKPILIVSRFPEVLWSNIRQCCVYAKKTPLARKLSDEHSGCSRRDWEDILSVGLHWLRTGELDGGPFSLSSDYRYRSASPDPCHTLNVSAGKGLHRGDIRDTRSSPPANVIIGTTEAQTRMSTQPKLDRFMIDLQERQEKGHSTLFDRNIANQLKLIGPEPSWHWGKFSTSCDSSEQCDYIATSPTAIRQYLEEGNTLRPIPHVIRGDRTTTHANQNQMFLSNLEALLGAELVEVQDHSTEVRSHGIDDHQPANSHVSFEALHSRYNCSEETPGFHANNLPMNLLDIWSLDLPHSDVFHGFPRFSGINIGLRSGRGVGKASYFSSHMKACTSFGLFGLRGAFSGPHVDIYGATIVTCLSGLKAWLTYTTCLDDPVLDNFASEGASWAPEGLFKLIVLQPGDTLIMPPGAVIIHAPITIETSTMSGSMFIDIEMLTSHARHVSFLLDNDLATNEFLSDDFPMFWDNIMEIVRHHEEEKRAELDTVDDELRKRLSCECIRKGSRAKLCSNHCVCRSRTLLPKCNHWCHNRSKTCCRGFRDDQE